MQKDFFTTLGIITPIISSTLIIVSKILNRKREIKQIQLNSLFLPLHKLLYKKYFDGNNFDTDYLLSILDDIEKILADNYLYCPNFLISVFFVEKNKFKKTLDIKSFNRFLSYTNAHFNYLKRNLGYPSDNIYIIFKSASTELKKELISMLIRYFVIIFLYYSAIFESLFPITFRPYYSNNVIYWNNIVLLLIAAIIHILIYKLL